HFQRMRKAHTHTHTHTLSTIALYVCHTAPPQTHTHTHTHTHTLSLSLSVCLCSALNRAACTQWALPLKSAFVPARRGEEPSVCHSLIDSTHCISHAASFTFPH